MKGKERPRRRRRWTPDARPWREKLDVGIQGTVADAAQALNVPTSFIYTHWRDLPGARKIGKYIRFDLRVLVNA